MPDNWSREETADPGFADQRNFYKVEKKGQGPSSKSLCLSASGS